VSRIGVPLSTEAALAVNEKIVGPGGVGEYPPIGVPVSGTSVRLGVLVGASVLVSVGAGVGVDVGVMVSVSEGVCVIVPVQVGVMLGVMLGVSVSVGVLLGSGVTVLEGVTLGVGVKVLVQVGYGVREGVNVKLAEGSTASVGTSTIRGSRGPHAATVMPTTSTHSTPIDQRKVARIASPSATIRNFCRLLVIICLAAAACQTLLAQPPASAQFPAAQPTRSPANTADSVRTLGSSVEGRAITARRFGSGPRALVFAGGIHGGWEANTVALVQQLIAHFEAVPGALRPGLSLYFIPVVNPDGLPRGRTPAGRFNARGVDLNRNWGCDWSPVAYWRSQRVNAGPAAFSEPETLALATFLREVQPVAAVFYHSAADGVFAGDCTAAAGVDADSAAMAAVYGEAAGYRSGAPFTAYPVNGTAANWADGQGIAAADVELTSHDDTEFERNLAAVMALQDWATGG
jgi:hypothetical protein